MSATDTTAQIARLQMEYDSLEQEGKTKFGSKARLLLEKQLREEMKKKLDALGGDIDVFKAKKRVVFQALHAAKQARREEIIAGVAAGKFPPDEAEKTIVALGWESGVAKVDVSRALGALNANHVTTAVELPTDQKPEPKGPEPIAVETEAVTPEAPAAAENPPTGEIMDPAGAAEPVTREVVYAEPGRRDEQETEKKRKGKR